MHDYDSAQRTHECFQTPAILVPGMFFLLCLLLGACPVSQVEFKAGKPPVLAFFDKVSGEETESISLEKLTLDEVRRDVIFAWRDAV